MKSRPIDTILRRQFAAAAAMGALIASIAAPASAQGQRPSAPAAATPAKPAPAVTFSVRDWTRYEHWSYFEPQPGGGDPTYGYISNRLQFGLQRQTTHYDVQGTMQYVQLGGLPANATGPGQLGLGAAYYVTNLATDPGHLYVKYLSLTLKRPAQGLTVRLGRIAYASGAESASGVPKIEAVKRQRVDSRLVGEFEWAQFQRSFDGARVDV